MLFGILFYFFSDFSVHRVELFDAFQVLLLFRVIDSQQFHVEIGRVVRLVYDVPVFCEVVYRILCSALVNAVAIHEQNKSVEERESLRVWLVDRRHDSLVLLVS